MATLTVRVFGSENFTFSGNSLMCSHKLIVTDKNKVAIGVRKFDGVCFYSSQVNLLEIAFHSKPVQSS